MRPTVGRIVHYFDPTTSRPEEEPQRGAWDWGSCRAAIITRVHADDCVNLTVFDDFIGEPQSVTSVEFRDEPEAGCCMWPPREEG